MSEIKDWVKKRYGKIASGGQVCCGGASSCCGDSAATAHNIGYTEGDLAAVPAGANLGLGCGNPLALAAVAPGDTVLDLGSGAGFDAFLAAERVGPHGNVIGVDLTPEMIEQARANAVRGGYSKVEFRLGDIENLPVADASIDHVVSNCVLNLVPNKPRAFAEIFRVLKPGGRIAIADIVLDGPLPKSLQGDEDGWCSCISGAVSRHDYLEGLAEAGLTEVTVVSETDAADLLAGDCCGEGSDSLLLKGIATSILVTGRKPRGSGK